MKKNKTLFNREMLNPAFRKKYEEQVEGLKKEVEKENVMTDVELLLDGALETAKYQVKQALEVEITGRQTIPRGATGNVRYHKGIVDGIAQAILLIKLAKLNG